MACDHSSFSRRYAHCCSRLRATCSISIRSPWSPVHAATTSTTWLANSHTSPTRESTSSLVVANSPCAVESSTCSPQLRIIPCARISSATRSRPCAGSRWPISDRWTAMWSGSSCRRLVSCCSQTRCVSAHARWNTSFRRLRACSPRSAKASQLRVWSRSRPHSSTNWCRSPNTCRVTRPSRSLHLSVWPPAQ